MCKPSCCPGQNRSSLPAAVAAVAVLAVLSAVARPLIHAAELVLQAALITIGAAVILTVVVLVTILLARARRSALRPRAGQVITVRAAAVPRPPARTWAQAALADRIHTLASGPRPEEALNRSGGVTACERRPGDAR
jgi:hypothetical protein